MRREEIILSALTKDSDFTKKAIPHIRSDFFTDFSERTVFELIDAFYKNYSKLPPRDVLLLELEQLKNVPEDSFDDVKKAVKSSFDDIYEYDEQWLLDETEKFCKERAVFNAIMKSVKIINGDEKKMTEGQIPGLLQEALSISFDHSIGHDYFENAKERFEFYSKKESKIECDIELLNKVTNGGVNRKTLNMFVAPPKAGKSLALCSLSAAYLRLGYNVLYITNELAEYRVGERIDANLMNVNVNDVKNLDPSAFMDKISFLKSKTHGRLKIKEYPIKTASTNHFRVLLDDLALKENFVPSVIVVDYMGITASAQYGNSATVNSYMQQKAVSEELRAMATDYDAALWTAVQTNRNGMNASDFDVEDISESTGPIMTCDLAIGLIRTPELDELNQMIWKQLASRYGDPSYYKRFVVGIDKTRMRAYNVEQNAQDDIAQEVGTTKDKPALDRYNKSKQKEVKADEWSFE